MNFYQQKIVDHTGCSEEDAPVLEEIMRYEVIGSGLLDALTPSKFKRAARVAFRMLERMPSLRADYT